MLDESTLTLVEKDKPSSTSEAAALQRALHQLLDDDPKILVDPFAIQIVDIPSGIDVAVEGRRPFFKEMRSRIVMRSRYAEDCLAEAVAERAIRQYVLLGAGLDTFAFRQPSWAQPLRIFEVDHPATQQWKKERLAAAGLVPPENLDFVPIDFESMSLSDGMRVCGFDLDSRTFCSWLGVTHYLTQEAIDMTFEFVRRLPHGSEIVFEFKVAAEALSSAEEKRDAAAARKAAAATGEPALSRFVPAELEAKLHRFGFLHVIALSPEDAQERYFNGRRDGLAAERTVYRLMRAIV
jgi:methyltransferase (TIGR00027 family)